VDLGGIGGGCEMMNESTDMFSSFLILVARKLKRGVKREFVLGLRGNGGKDRKSAELKCATTR